MILLLLLVYAVNGDTRFAAEPESVTAVIGSSATIECLVDGPKRENANLVQWVKGNLALGFPPLTNERYSQLIGPEDYSLKISDVQLSDEDEFECQITPVGLRSKTAKLVTLAPPKTVDISPVGGDVKILKEKEETFQVIAGKPTKLRCIATDSKPKTDLSWSISGESLNSTSSVSGDLLLTTFSEVILIPRKKDHLKKLQCKANNIALQTPTTVDVMLDVQTLPEVAVRIKDEELSDGSSMAAECLASGNPPVTKYEWRYNGNILDTKNSSKIEMVVDWTMDENLISCTAINIVGQTTADAEIEVKYGPVLLSAPDRRFVANSSGQEVQLECDFAGNPKPEVFWTKTGSDKVLAQGQKIRFESVQQSDAGRFNCIAQSPLGEAKDSIDLAIRGPPAIISAREQWGKTLECAFTAEPLPQVVRVLDLSKSEKSAIVHEVFNHNSTKIEIQIDVGQYECQVQNELGMTSTVIAILPEGLGLGSKIGIVVAILVVSMLLLFVACVKLKFFPREHRHKLKPDIDRDEYLIGNNRSEKHFSGKSDQPIEIVHASGFSGATRVERASSDEIFKPQIDIVHDHPKTRGLGLANNINSESGSTGRSNHDDGYGTESGSNQKVNTVSTDSSNSESNSDYEVHVASLSGSVAVPSSERSSKICVIWDDSTTHAYQPQQIRNQTQLLQTRMNRTRSVSHV